jgi:hypothetical protein
MDYVMCLTVLGRPSERLLVVGGLCDWAALQDPQNQYVQAEATAIFPDRKLVEARSADGLKFYVNFDKLAICTGSQVGPCCRWIVAHGGLQLAPAYLFPANLIATFDICFWLLKYSSNDLHSLLHGLIMRSYANGNGCCEDHPAAEAICKAVLRSHACACCPALVDRCRGAPLAFPAWRNTLTS